MSGAPRRKTKASRRALASFTLSDLESMSRVKAAAGRERPTDPWLRVLANILSSAPPGKAALEGRAPERFRLTYQTLVVAAERCGVGATREQIDRQVVDTLQWRRSETERTGAPHYIPMSPDAIGELLQITEAERREAKAWNLGTIGGSPEARREAARERDRQRKAQKRVRDGAMTRAEYLAACSKGRPWETLGLSRATYYRRLSNSNAKGETGSSETGSSATNKDRETGSSATNIDYRANASSASGLEALGHPADDHDDIATHVAEPAMTPGEVLARISSGKNSPAPPYSPQPGGLAARALATIRKPLDPRSSAARAKTRAAAAYWQSVREGTKPPTPRPSPLVDAPSQGALA